MTEITERIESIEIEKSSRSVTLTTSAGRFAKMSRREFREIDGAYELLKTVLSRLNGEAL